MSEARVTAMPVPRCLHGNPWHSCPTCGEQRPKRREPPEGGSLMDAQHAPRRAAIVD